MNRPIIFCHYGYSDYLEYTLKTAKLNNPGKDVVLIGDTYNRKVALRNKCKFIFYDDLNYGYLIQLFDNCYKLIQGDKHYNWRNGRDWVRFVFKRWFYVYNFAHLSNLSNGFWHFDSDNMILTSLTDQEFKFEKFDCTEQCNSKCMNGFISSIEVVEKYLNKIIELFKDESFIKMTKNNLKPEHAFTEMRAYLEFRGSQNINSTRLNSNINNESFDDAICSDDNNVMDNLKYKIKKNEIKRVYLVPGGLFYCMEKNRNLIKMNSLNLSWVPLITYKIIYDHSKKKKFKRLKKQITNYPILSDEINKKNVVQLKLFNFHTKLKRLFYYT